MPGFSMSNGTWSWSSPTVTYSINPSSGTVSLKNNSSNASVSVSMSGAGSFTLPTPLGTLTLNSNGSGDVKVTGGSAFFSADLSFTVGGQGISINKLTLDAQVTSSGLSALVSAKTVCEATLAPVIDQIGFDGFTGTAECKASIGSWFSWQTGKYTGTMNNGDFLNMVPGVSVLKDGLQRQQEYIDNITLNDAKDYLNSYMDVPGYNGGEGIFTIDPYGGYYENAQSQKTEVTNYTTGIPGMDPLMADLVSAGCIGYVGDSGEQGPGGYGGGPKMTGDEMMFWNMRSLLSSETSPNSAMMSATGDTDFQKMIYFQAMTSAMQATSAGYAFGGGPAS